MSCWFLEDEFTASSTLRHSHPLQYLPSTYCVHYPLLKSGSTCPPGALLQTHIVKAQSGVSGVGDKALCFSAVRGLTSRWLLHEERGIWVGP